MNGQSETPGGIKHKRASYRGWHRVMDDEEQVIHVPQGTLVDYRAVTVVKPLRVPVCGELRTILDSGFRWVHYAPRGAGHALTVHLDPAGVPQQLYVDIGIGAGLDPDGVPFLEDLYLDVTALCEVEPAGNWHVTATEIIDQNELEGALAAGHVTQAQYDLAWAEAHAVQAALLTQRFEPADVVRRYLSDPYS